MRLAEDKVKEALEHPDRIVRGRALMYFTHAYRTDRDLMPRVIRAIEKYGRQDAYWNWDQIAFLAQTEATLDWIIRELNRPGEPDEAESACDAALSLAAAWADVAVLEPREWDVREARRIDEREGELDERMQMASWDAETCWQEAVALASACAETYEGDWEEEDWDEEEVDEEESDEEDWDTNKVGRLAEAAARHPVLVDRALKTLARTGGRREHQPSYWLDSFLVLVLGWARQDRAVPVLLSWLGKDEEFLDSYIEEALVRIGSEAVVSALAAGWGTWDPEDRTTAASILEDIHSDASERACRQLLEQETDQDVRALLVRALLSHLADGSVELARRMVLEEDEDPEMEDLRGPAVEAATLLGVRFPEYAEWRRYLEQWLSSQKELDEWDSDEDRPAPELKVSLNDFLDGPLDDEPEEEAVIRPEDFPAMTYEPDPVQQPFVRNEKRVGRNDPCPCGSGKKYKKCCMPKE